MVVGIRTLLSDGEQGPTYGQGGKDMTERQRWIACAKEEIVRLEDLMGIIKRRQAKVDPSNPLAEMHCRDYRQCLEGTWCQKNNIRLLENR